MAYTKTTLISRPAPSSSMLSGVVDTLKSGASSALDFFGAGLKAQGAQEALAQQLAEQRAAQAAPAAQAGGVSTTALVVGGLAVAGLLVFAMRKK